MTLTYFWLILTIACLVWYSSVTVIVAVMGFRDIFAMLRKLKEDHEAQNPALRHDPRNFES